MGLTDELNRLNAARALIRKGGGEDKVSAQHALSKKTARERIAALLDDDSFVELDAFIPLGEGGESVVTGYGTVSGRPVYLYAQDYTVMGGSVGAAHAKKVVRVMEMAQKCGAPVVAMCDSGGARFNEGPAALAAYADIMAASAQLSGVVPQIAAVLGPCVGGAAITAALSDIVLMSKKSGRLLSSGPQVMAARAGGDPAKLCGGDAAAAQGIAHIVCEDDETVIAALRALLDYLPSNSLDESPYETPGDLNRTLSEWDADVMPDGRALIAGLSDNGGALELCAAHAPELVTSLARIGGQAVGVIAGASPDGAALGAHACSKAARFIRTMNAFNIPVVTLVNFEGFEVVAEKDNAALIKAAAQLAYAYAEAAVPKVAVLTGAAVGAAYAVMGASRKGADMVLAWPGARVAVATDEAAVRILYKDELKAGQPLETLIERYRQNDASALAAATQGLVDDVIAPSETRKRVIYALEMMLAKHTEQPARKHGNMPL